MWLWLNELDVPGSAMAWGSAHPHEMLGCAARIQTPWVCQRNAKLLAHKLPVLLARFSQSTFAEHDTTSRSPAACMERATA